MGRNGAGKSTLLRHAAGPAAADPRAASAPPAGSRCCCRTRATTWSTSGWPTRRPPAALRARRPRPDVLRRAPSARAVGRRAPAAGPGRRARRREPTPPAVVCLDEPTRGMDRARKAALAALLQRPGRRGDRRHPRSRVRRRLRRPGGPAGRRRGDRRRADAPRSWPAAATSPPRRPGSSGAPAGAHPGPGGATAALEPPSRRRTRGGRAMSWQLGALRAARRWPWPAGFAWYERTRPDARIVALVGDAGRVRRAGPDRLRRRPQRQADHRHRARSPATRSAAAPASRSGPWPAWPRTSSSARGRGPRGRWRPGGPIGVLGAGLALVSAPADRPDRPLAAGAAASCGFAFTVVQDVGDWVTYSDHSLAQLGLYVGRGLGFDAVHAAGCVAFALAFGPALIRSLQRFARRLQVTWVPLDGAAPVPGCRWPPCWPRCWPCPWCRRRTRRGPRPARPWSEPSPTCSGAQNADGGFGADRVRPRRRCSPAGRPSASPPPATRPLAAGSGGRERDRLRAQPPARQATSARWSGRSSSPAPPGCRRAASPATISSPRCWPDAAPTARSAEQVNLTAFAVLALRSAGMAPAPAHDRLAAARQQNSDGGFGFAAAERSSDLDDTGAVLEALAGVPGAGRGPRARRGVPAPRSRTATAALPRQPGAGSNAQSTAWAIQGLLAAGVPPASVRHGGRPRRWPICSR